MGEDRLIVDYENKQVKRQTLGDISDAVAKMALQKVNAAQHRMHLTAIAAGGLCVLAGFGLGWLVFAC